MFSDSKQYVIKYLQPCSYPENLKTQETRIVKVYVQVKTSGRYTWQESISQNNIFTVLVKKKTSQKLASMTAIA